MRLHAIYASNLLPFLLSMLLSQMLSYGGSPVMEFRQKEVLCWHSIIEQHDAMLLNSSKYIFYNEVVKA